MADEANKTEAQEAKADNQEQTGTSSKPDKDTMLEQQAVAIRQERKARKALEAKLAELTGGAESNSGESKSDDIAHVVESVLEARERREASRIIEETLDGLTDDEVERSAILSAYENRLKPSGFSPKSIASDLKTAQLLVNPGVIAKQVEADVKKAEATKAAMSNAKAGNLATKGDEGEEAEPRYTKAVKRMRRGLQLSID